ncbi:MAG: low molecular weight phosphatase family protein [Patescibacteria group bacterium]
MSDILFVCTGNAARSQFAEAYYNQLTDPSNATSAGTEVIVGKPLPDDVKAVLLEHEIDYESLHRKQISKELFEQASKVILFTEKSLPEYLSRSDKVETFQVDDPRGLGLQAHRDAFEKIIKIVQAELKAV